MGANKGAGRMLVLAALREHGRLREAAVEVIAVFLWINECMILSLRWKYMGSGQPSV